LTWGKDVEFLQKRAEAGKPAPALENRPELYEDLADVWDLFWQLHRSRQCGFGACPLSVMDIRAALELYAVADKVEFYELIVTMDQEWLKWADEQSHKERK
jgi:hypothetical protein